MQEIIGAVQVLPWEITVVHVSLRREERRGPAQEGGQTSALLQEASLRFGSRRVLTPGRQFFDLERGSVCVEMLINRGGDHV